MKRQAMEVSVKDLRDKANELELELLEMEYPLKKEVLTQKCQVAIINNNDTSDEWKFEKSESVTVIDWTCKHKIKNIRCSECDNGIIKKAKQDAKEEVLILIKQNIQK